MILIDVDESLKLINYIKGMQRKGFTKEEIKERLLQVGWSQSSIDKYLREEVLSGKFTQQGGEAIQAFAEYGRFLLADEVIESTYHIGLHSLLITNKRLLVLEKFPKNVSEYYFHDLELVEFYTTIQWLRALYAALYLFGAVIFAVYHLAMWEKLVAVFPPSATFFNFRPLFGFDLATLVIVGYLSVYFCVEFVHFVSSFFGRLRILPKDVGPKEIITRFTPDVEEFLSKIEIKLEKQHSAE